ncbi:hypothetical protein HPB51_029705 [Rhipicephalus microplus]|uniref:Uncharacterized protein n=1 Tax=Rhipicephalus microplus TaxID=6941 RepID=A0A9J6CTP1_RHIMP|nr:hypothetical protein HPB51_029705 [Rhipicephalus microplus]
MKCSKNAAPSFGDGARNRRRADDARSSSHDQVAKRSQRPRVLGDCERPRRFRGEPMQFPNWLHPVTLAQLHARLHQADISAVNRFRPVQVNRTDLSSAKEVQKNCEPVLHLFCTFQNEWQGSAVVNAAPLIRMTEEHEALNRSFSNLKDALGRSTDISDIEPSVYFGPFLEAIRSDDTSGIVTGQALASVNKFLSYGLLDHRLESSASSAESIADAVTHARFMGIDPASDEVVLMKILLVLRSLLLSHVGALLSNESVCEMMQSCIRICFEPRLSELLRKSAEQALMDMVQLLFSRLPQFSEVAKGGCSKKLKMRASGMDNSRSARKRRSPVPKHRKIPREPDSQIQQQTPSFPQPVGNVASQQHLPGSEEQQSTGEAAGPGKGPSPGIMTEPEVPAAPDSSLESEPLTGVIHLSDSVPSIADLDPSQTDSSGCAQEGSEGALSISQELVGREFNLVSHEPSSLETSIEKECSGTVVTMGGTGDNDYVNPHGVRFTALHGNREGIMREKPTAH